jgi:hypothetical protein
MHLFDKTYRRSRSLITCTVHATAACCPSPIEVRAQSVLHYPNSTIFYHVETINLEGYQCPSSYLGHPESIPPKSRHHSTLPLDITSLVHPPPIDCAHFSPAYLPLHWQEHVIEKGKRLVGKMHSYATQLMDTYGEQYILLERDEELGINIRIRTRPTRLK